ncbi:hypothetical protein D9M72_655880 [compost metagenome]
MEPSRAAQKPPTVKPDSRLPTNRNSSALMTKINSPSVSSVTGSVRITRIGRISVLTRPSTSAASIAEPKLLMWIDGMMYGSTNSATALMTQTTSSLMTAP